MTEFGVDQYVALSRVQGTFWTVADIVICLYLTRLANLLREAANLRPHRIPYLALAATIPLALLLPIAPNAAAFFRLEVLITVPHFCIILYVLAANYRVRHRLLASLPEERAMGHKTDNECHSSNP